VIRQRVATLKTGYGTDYDRYIRSAYYHEYAGANRAHDPLAAAFSLGAPGMGSLALLQFWHARPDGRLFGGRELALLRLLFPAFQAVVEAQVRWGNHRSDLLDTLDALGQAVLVCDLTGKPLHQTPALSVMLLADPEGPMLSCELVAVMNALRRTVRIPATACPDEPACPVVMEVRTGFAHYVIRASLYGGSPAGSVSVILVALERCTSVPLSYPELREAFGLTRAEVRVAMLLARGRSNAEIADQLFISPHTARRHTERVLMKMNVPSRAKVGPKVFR